MGYAVPGALCALSMALAVWTYSLMRREQAAYRNAELSDGDLYASGKAAARSREKGRLPRVSAFLHHAGIEASPVLWLASVAAMSFVAYAVASTLSSNAGTGLVCGFAMLAGLVARVELLRKRRRALFDRQFARVLPQLASSVRSALTLERAVRVAASHVEEPLREEFARVLADAAYGTTLTVAFEDMARRTGSPDVRALAAAIRIQQRFGGAVAPVLDMIADRANARLKTSRELKAELAGTRLAKWFVAASMPAIFFIMFATNADFARFYQEEPLGWAVIGGAVFFEAFGLAACQRITSMKGDDRS